MFLVFVFLCILLAISGFSNVPGWGVSFYNLNVSPPARRRQALCRVSG